MNAIEESILVVDDDPRFRELVSELLRNNGYQVNQARSTKEATAVLEGGNPALLIVDYRLPDQNGLSWIASLREAGCNSSIILISGTWLDKGTFDVARNIHRVSLILRKPIAPLLFLTQIKSLLPLRRKGSPVSPDKAARRAAAASLERMRVSYMKELPGTWAELSSAVSAAKDDPNSRGVAVQHAHRLRGSAGSLGLNIIGQVAGRIEDLFNSMVNTGDSRTWSEIQACLDEGLHYLNEGLFQVPSPPHESISVIPEAAQKIPSKVLLYTPFQDEEVFKATSLFSGGLELITSSSVSKQLLSHLDAGSSLDAAVVRASNSRELLQATSAIRDLPGASGLPLAVLPGDSATFELGTFLYAGVSLSIGAVVQQDLEAALETLLQLSRERKPRVLNIEDDATVSELLGTVLSNENMLVYALDEPIRTIEVLNSFKPDVVLLDVFMPGLSGYDVCAMIRSTPEWSKVPVIFLTSNNDAESRSLAFEAGASDFVSKPVVADEVSARVKAHLSRFRFGGNKKLTTELLSPMHLLERLHGIPPSSSKLAVCLIELDGFYEIMARHGYEAVVEPLNLLRELILERFALDAFRASWGDFGFALAFADTDLAEFIAAMNFLAEEFKDVCVSRRMEHTYSLRIGIASSPEDGKTVPETLCQAQMRLRRQAVSAR